MAARLNHDVMDQSLDIICSLDSEGRFLSVSAACERVWGYRPAELIGRPCTDFIHPDDVERTRGLAPELVAGRAREHFENRYLRKDGSAVQMMWSSRWSAEQQMFFCVAHDTTELRRADHERRGSELRFRAVTQSIGDAIISANAAGEIIFWNSGAEKIFGRAAAETMGQEFTLVLPERDRAQEREGLARYLDGAESRRLGKTVEMLGLHADGREFPIDLTLSSWKTEEGLFFTGIIRDISERRHAADALREEQERLVTSVHRLRMLCDTTSKSGLIFAEKLKGLLQDGCRGLGLENGIFARVSGDLWEVEHAFSETGSNYENFACSLQDTICQEVISRDAPVLFEHAALSEEWSQHPGYLKHGVEAYIGAPVRVAGNIYGALCFVSPKPRAQAFTQADVEFLRLIGQWMSFEVEREQTEIALRASERELKEAKITATLQESAERYAFLADAMPQIVWTSKPDGNLDYYNKAWLDYTGLTLEETKDWGWGPVLHPEDLDACVDRWTHCFTTGENYEVEYRFKRAADGAYRWHLGRAVPMRNEEGTIVQWVGTCTDIDDQKRSRAKLEQLVAERTAELSSAQERLQQVLDAATGVAIIATDPAGLITVFNSGAERMLQYSAEELVGHRSPALFHEEAEVRQRGEKLTQEFGRPIQGFDAFVEYARQGRRETREWTYRRKDGRVLTVALDVTATHDASGEINGFLGVATDVTTRKNAEAALVQAKEAAEAANRAKSEFLANMSHEIRTPMNGILGMTELVLDTELTREQREYLGMAKTSANSLLGLINDILDFSKIEAGKLEIESIDFSLRDCVGGMLKPLGLRADQKGVELVADIPADVPDSLVGDPMRLRQILINLTDNAIKFTAKGDVVLRVINQAAPGGETHLHFTVTDSGIGIPPEKQSAIFEAFAQADGSTTRTFGGTGLGLSIASQLIRKMGGKIWLESRVGEGTTFHFTTRLRVCAKPLRSAPREPASVEGLRVLVVDDNAVNRRILQEMLSNWRMQPTMAESAAAALVEIERAARAGSDYELVLLDAIMPTTDGFALAETLQDHPASAGATVMMLSSGMVAGNSERCRALGISSFLTKPVTQSDLLDAILIALDARTPIETKVETAQPATMAPSVPGLRILLAEDNLINRALATGLLEKQGHTLVHAVNGVEVLRALDAATFDLVLMDVQMPEMDGFEATRRVRAIEAGTSRHTPIIAMTAHAMAGDRERCLEAGMDGYVAKPIQREGLLKVMEEVLQDLGRRKTSHPAPEQPAIETRPFLFTRAQMLDQCGDDEELMGRLVALFCENTPQILDQIRDAIFREDASALKQSGAQAPQFDRCRRRAKCRRVGASTGRARRARRSGRGSGKIWGVGNRNGKDRRSPRALPYRRLLTPRS